MGGAMLSKSLIHFSVDGWGYVPSLSFDLRLKYGGGNEDNGDLIQRSHAHSGTLSAPNPAAGHHRPTPLPETPGHPQAIWGSLLWGHCSFLLGPGARGSVCALQESISQSCVSSGGSMVGLMVTSSKRAYAIPRPVEPRAPVPEAGHC